MAKKEGGGCGGCLGKILIFGLGMLFGVIAFLSSIVGAGFYLYKNGSINFFSNIFGFENPVKGEKADEFSDLSIEQLYQRLSSLDFDTTTIRTFESEFGIDLGQTLNSEIPDSLKDMAVFALFTNQELFFKSVKIGGLIPSGSGMPKALLDALNDKSLHDIMDGGFAALFGDIYVGDIMNNVRGECTEEGHTGEQHPLGECTFVWYANEQDKTDNKPIQSLDKTISSIAVKQLFDGSFSVDSLGIKDMKIGEILEYKQVLKDEDVEHEHTDECMKWVDKDDNDVTGVVKLFVDSTANDVADTINDMTIADVLDLTLYDEEKAATPDPDNEGKYGKYDENGEFVPETSGIIQKMADIKVQEMSGPVLTERINDMTILEVITPPDGGFTGIMKLIQDTKIGGLNDRISAMLIGEIMEYTRSECIAVHTDKQHDDPDFDDHANCKYVWYEKDVLDEDGEVEIAGKKVTGLFAALADLRTDELGDGSTVKNQINGVLIGEIMGYEKVPQADCLIDGHTHGAKGECWQKLDGDDYVGPTGVSKALADLCIEDFENSETIKGAIDDLEAREFFTGGSQDGILGLVFANEPDVKLGEFASVATTCVQTATMRELVHHGVLNIDPDSNAYIILTGDGEYAEMNLAEFVETVLDNLTQPSGS